jgi:hypothetical protein
VEVRKAAGFPGSLKRILVAPIPCAEGIDCVALEKKLLASSRPQFSKLGIRVDSPGRLKDLLFEKGSVEEPSREEVVQLATELGCDAVLFASIVSSEAKEAQAGIWANRPATVQSSTELVLQGVDGTLWLRGQASADSAFQTDQTFFAAKQLSKILKQALK